MRFEMTEDESALALQWWKTHKCVKKNHTTAYAGAIGGALSYEVVPTSIGILLNAYCSWCEQRMLLNGDDI